MNFGFIIDNRKCIGCHACTVACKSEHQVPIGVNRTWVKYIEKGEFPDTRRLFSVMRCNHCADAPCVEICPVTALYTRADGIVDFDDRRCIGCKACTQACPYDALYMHPDNHTAAKCNYCSHRTDIGLEPACVVVCPEHAIISGDMDNPNTEISKLLARETVSVRKEEKGTSPKLFYIDGDKVSLNPTAANTETDYMWSSQASGVGHFAKYAEERINNSPLREEAVKQNFVQIEPVRKKARRVYDAPSKGVLWGWEVSAYVLTKAIAAGAFLLPVAGGYFMEIPWEVKQFGAVLAFIFLAVTGVLLVMDLGRPDRFLNVLFRPQWKSWLSRGAYIITAYGAVLTAWLAASFFAYERVLSILEPAGIALALLTAVYTAFLFAQAKGRDFWQSPMLGLHMIIHAIMAGFAVFLIASPILDVNFGFRMVVNFLAVAALVFHLISLAIELTTTHTTDDAQRTVKMITRGEFSKPFWFGMILAGNVAPLLLLLANNTEALRIYFAEQSWSAVVAGILILIGLWFAEDIWVKAPQRIPLS
ncbi:MAG TPA: NrfD/PsrC family molybdoenzyme membrane anchor subunit [Pyrinomonadaceae bacterium]|jgi:Fe-S-cluster-containing dehydrogenase component/formate-dependent nitrite reductase membrane component NrfD